MKPSPVDGTVDGGWGGGEPAADCVMAYSEYLGGITPTLTRPIKGAEMGWRSVNTVAAGWGEGKKSCYRAG
jgi:hypothetical protein